MPYVTSIENENWTPTAGDSVRFVNDCMQKTHRVKCFNRKFNAVSIYIADGKDEDGDIVFRVQSFKFSDLVFVAGHR